MVLPITLEHFTPTPIFAVGIGAIAAAVMSSTDSYLLSATTIFTTNIYQAIRSKVKTNSSVEFISTFVNIHKSFICSCVQASDKELQWVIRISIVVGGLVGTSITYLKGNVLLFWMLGSDLAYTILLPQLICILFIKVSNGYGAVVGFFVAIVMRILCGEPLLGLPVLLCFPGCTLTDGVYTQRFPFKTACMLSALASIPLSSYVASLLFNKGVLPQRWDVFEVTSHGEPADGARDAADANDEHETFDLKA